MVLNALLPPAVAGSIPARGDCLYLYKHSFLGLVLVGLPTVLRRARKAVGPGCYEKHQITIVTHSRQYSSLHGHWLALWVAEVRRQSLSVKISNLPKLGLE